MSIPKIAHRIWFGDPFPEKYKNYLRTLVDLNPEYVIKLWSDPETVSQESYQTLQIFCEKNNVKLCNIREFVNLENYDLIIEELNASKENPQHKKLNYVRCSDISRISILISEGGIYTDTDSKMLAPFPTEVSDRKIILKTLGDPQKNFYFNFFEVNQKSYRYYFPHILYDFMASEPDHPLLKMAAKINVLDYQTYHASANKQWELSTDRQVLTYGTIRLTGTALKYALNYMHQAGKMVFGDVRELFFHADDIMQAYYDKSWLTGFSEKEEFDISLGLFLDEIDDMRAKKYVTTNHGEHPDFQDSVPDFQRLVPFDSTDFLLRQSMNKEKILFDHPSIAKLEEFPEITFKPQNIELKMPDRKELNIDMILQRNKDSSFSFINKQEFLEILQVKLAILDEKAKELQQRSCVSAFDAVTVLHTELVLLKDNFSANIIDYNSFKIESKKAINAARPELEKHRGWKEILANVALCILGLGIGYLAVCAWQGRFFKCNTDSQNRLDELQNTIAPAR